MIRKIYYTGSTRPKLKLEVMKEVRYFHTPTIKIIFDHPELFDGVESHLAKSPLIIFQSKNGVRGFCSWLEYLGRSVKFESKSIWAVGTSTAREVRTSIHQAVQQPDEQNARGLIKAFMGLKKRPVLLITGHETRPEFVTWLRDNRWDVLQIPVYKTEIFENQELYQLFQNSNEEVVIFTSPSTVQGFLKSTYRDDLSGVVSLLVSIGPTTSVKIKSCYGNVSYEAPEPDVSKIASVITSDLILPSKTVT